MMHRYSNLKILVMLPIMGNIFFGSYVEGDPFFDSILNPESLLAKFPTFAPERILKGSVVQPCQGESVALMEAANMVLNTSPLISGGNSNGTSVNPCEGIIGNLIQFDERTKCDLSYVVSILGNRNGARVVVAQGIILCDDTILASFQTTQRGDACDPGLYVLYQDGCIREVHCMKKLKAFSANLLTHEVYTIQLVVKPNCSCPTYYFKEPEFFSGPETPFMKAHYLSPDNITCKDYGSWSLNVAYIPDPLAAALVVPDKPGDVQPSGEGGPVITLDCKVLAIVVTKPLVLVRTASSLPLTKDTKITSCALTAAPISNPNED